MIISAALGHFFKSLKIPCLSLLFGRALPTSLGCYMNQESWSPQCLRMASRLEANKHDGNGSCLVTMATSDITDSYLWCSSPTTSIKSHMHLGPKYGNKCLLRLHNIHGNVLRWQSHSSGSKMCFFLQWICLAHFPSGEVNVLFCNQLYRMEHFCWITKTAQLKSGASSNPGPRQLTQRHHTL